MLNLYYIIAIFHYLGCHHTLKILFNINAHVQGRKKAKEWQEMKKAVNETDVSLISMPSEKGKSLFAQPEIQEISKPQSTRTITGDAKYMYIHICPWNFVWIYIMFTSRKTYCCFVLSFCQVAKSEWQSCIWSHYHFGRIIQLLRI